MISIWLFWSSFFMNLQKFNQNPYNNESKNILPLKVHKIYFRNEVAKRVNIIYKILFIYAFGKYPLSRWFCNINHCFIKHCKNKRGCITHVLFYVGNIGVKTSCGVWEVNDTIPLQIISQSLSLVALTIRLLNF